MDVFLGQVAPKGAVVTGVVTGLHAACSFMLIFPIDERG